MPARDAAQQTVSELADQGEKHAVVDWLHDVGHRTVGFLDGERTSGERDGGLPWVREVGSAYLTTLPELLATATAHARADLLLLC